ncbi:hypothetical protein DL764_002209 [Monosporascus ibericus]|uniref:DUF1993 domain-containing protein n=1 Tax=Monosporascus ibericus TaxID=155417 RepID=A0A4Q4TMP1_9PEZI|nr:hypothetical protein DL764_002209 [Monosporascus ibericus]
MPSLYDISIPILTGALRAELHLLKKGADWATEKGFTSEELVNWRIHETMLPLWAQVAITVRHARLALNYLTGSTLPVVVVKEAISLEGLLEMIDTTLKQLTDVGSVEKISAEESAVVTSKIGDGQCHLTVLDTVQLYTMPNIYFHFTTLYDILRMKGVPLGKGDFAGAFLEGAIRD